MISWLKKNKQYIKINAIDRELHKLYGMPLTTLNNEIKGSQKMSDKWVPFVNKFVEELKNSNDSEL